jgi:hypothetical protein
MRLPRLLMLVPSDIRVGCKHAPLPDLTVHPRTEKHTGQSAAMPDNTSIEYFPAPVTYNSKKPPIMLRFL